MRVVAVLVVLALFAASARAQTLCAKYATALGLNQSALMETVIGDVIDAVVSDSQIVGWFNGSFGVKGHVFVGTGADASLVTTLTGKLIAFFGQALGCNDAAFNGTGQYSVATTGVSLDMTAIHGTSNFQKAVTKLPYELFNIHILNVLGTAGVSTEDLYTISTVLDAFRGAGLQGGSSSYMNAVCQGSDCYTAPFTVYMYDNYFAPSYYAVPNGGSVTFVNAGKNNHQPAQNAQGSCSPLSGGWESKSSYAAGATPYTTPALKTNGAEYFDCQIHCGSGMNGSLLISTLASGFAGSTTGSPSPSSTGSAVSIVLAFSAMLAAIIAMLF